MGSRPSLHSLITSRLCVIPFRYGVGQTVNSVPLLAGYPGAPEVELGVLKTLLQALDEANETVTCGFLGMKVSVKPSGRLSMTKEYPSLHAVLLRLIPLPGRWPW